MTLEKLRTNIKQALNGNSLSINERVILSTFLYHNRFETAWKLRIGIREVDAIIEQFSQKTLIPQPQPFQNNSL